MAVERENTGRKVVIDAGAAIRLQRLERLGGELYSTGGVIREIRDERARALLETLPTELRSREPSTEDVVFVQNFAKQTGDFGFLSRNDVELIALTLALHREAGGEVRERPVALEAVVQQAGFEWAPAAADKKPEAQAEEAPARADAAELEATGNAPKDASTVDREAAEEPAAKAEDASEGAGATEPKAAETAMRGADEPAAKAEEAEEDGGAKEEGWRDVAATAKGAEDSDSDGSSAGEWVTVDNIKRFGLGVRAADIGDSDIKVACATGDYSVQNVLLQMGLMPLTFDGFAVRSVKVWGLVCRACFTFTRDTSKMFCPKCGHSTVQRVPITVGADGEPKVHDGRRRRNLKGTIYSVPKPQGGRAWKPIFAEDEIQIGGRDRELRHQEKIYEKERQLRNPFDEDNGARGWWQRSTTATGKMVTGEAPRVRVGYGRGNPNANNHKFSGRKRR